MIFYILNSDSEIVETIQSPNDTGMGGITATEGIVDEKLDTYELLTLTVPADAEGLENISEDMNIIFKDISGWREYTIYEIEDEDGDNFFTTIRAELGSSELIDEIVEEDLYGVSKDPRTVLTHVLEGTRYSVGTVDSSVYAQDFNVHTEYMNVLEVLNEYAKNYGAEIRFSYQVQGNKVVGRFVNIYKQYGEYKGKVFDIDRDMTSVTRRINTELIKTTIIPYSTEQQIDPDNTETDETHRFGIEDVEWSIANGDPADKPLGQNYLVDPIALETWGQTNEDGSKRHRKISMEFDLDNPEAIIRMAWVQLGRYTQPRVYYEVSAVDLYGLTNDEDLIHEQILLGDTGGVKDHYFANPIEIQTRAVEITRDLFDPRNNDYVFGNAKQIFSVNESVEAAEDMIKDVEELVKTVGDFQTVIDGSTKVYRGSNAPVEPNENDLWFRPHPVEQGHTQMLLFNGTTWEVRADSSDLEDAGRLKFGTIDGAEINVINLIADNITGGQLKLEKGIEITNKGIPVLKVNGAGEVEMNVSKMTINAMNLEEQLDKINNIEVGGRNLLTLYGKDSLKSYGAYNSRWYIEGTMISTTVNVNQTNSLNLTLRANELSYVPKEGELYTVSGFLKVNDGIPEDSVFSNNRINTQIHISRVQDFKYNPDTGFFSTTLSDTSTWLIHARTNLNPGDTLKIDKLMVEKGTKATDWTEAPEDTQAKLDELARKEDLNKVITKIITEYNSSSSATTAPTSGWSTNAPAWKDGHYIWSRTTIVYKDGTEDNSEAVNISGASGESGSGSDGRSVAEIYEEYYHSDSATEYTGGSWSRTAPDWSPTKYIWSRTTIVYQNPSGTHTTTPVNISGGQGPQGPKGADGSDGSDGKDGAPGKDGEDGKTTYTWVRYANDANGNGISEHPAGKLYLGIANNKTTQTATNNPSDYTWSLFRGPKGEDGVQGPQGKQGNPTYTWVKYSANSDGSGMTNTPTGNTSYIGLAYNKTTKTESSDPGEYTWTLFKGPQGIQGPKGTDGQSQHVHIRYSDNSNGNPMYPSPSANTKYIGIAVTSLPSAPGYTGFSWSKYVGEDGKDGKEGSRGVPGVPGTPGKDGKTTYTWVKYADTPTSGMNDYPENKKYIGLAFNQTTATESVKYEDYQWSLMPQNIRVGGRNLLKLSDTFYENTGYPVATYELTEPILDNTEVTLSIKGDLGRQRFGIYNSGGSVSMTTIVPSDKENGIFQKTFKWRIGGSSNTMLYVYPMPTNTGTATTIEWAKLEYGNIATDWSEAPEDTQDKIDEKAGTNVTDSISDELSDWITSTATTEELGEINSKMEDYLEALEADRSNLEEAKKDITNMLTRLPLVERDLGEWADQWNFIDTYIRMADEGLLIQEVNGDTGIRVSSDRIDFLPYDEKGNPVAYITNQVMKINRAIFVESMQVGEHKIQTVANGHTIWQWMK